MMDDASTAPNSVGNKPDAVDWDGPLWDSAGWQHQLVVKGSREVVTKQSITYAVWDRRTGCCLRADCEDLKMTNAPMNESVRARLKEEARLEWESIKRGAAGSPMYAIGGDPERGYTAGPFPQFDPSWLEDDDPIYMLASDGSAKLAIAEMALHCTRMTERQVNHLRSLDRGTLRPDEVALVDAAIEGSRYPMAPKPIAPPAHSFRDRLRQRGG